MSGVDGKQTDFINARDAHRLNRRHVSRTPGALSQSQQALTGVRGPAASTTFCYVSLGLDSSPTCCTLCGSAIDQPEAISSDPMSGRKNLGGCVECCK